MKKTIEIINELKANGHFKEYAIGGAIAALKWTEPFFTRDLDVFIIPEGDVDERQVIVLSSIYEYLKGKGYDAWTGQWLIIEGTPVEFIPAVGVAEEAVANAVETTFEGVKTRVMSPEYLIALFLKASRDKDKMKVRLLLDQAVINTQRLRAILTKYDLVEKYERFGQ